MYNTMWKNILNYGGMGLSTIGGGLTMTGVGAIPGAIMMGAGAAATMGAGMIKEPINPVISNITQSTMSTPKLANGGVFGIPPYSNWDEINKSLIPPYQNQDISNTQKYDIKSGGMATSNPPLILTQMGINPMSIQNHSAAVSYGNSTLGFNSPQNKSYWNMPAPPEYKKPIPSFGSQQLQFPPNPGKMPTGNHMTQEYNWNQYDTPEIAEDLTSLNGITNSPLASNENQPWSVNGMFDELGYSNYKKNPDNGFMAKFKTLANGLSSDNGNDGIYPNDKYDGYARTANIFNGIGAGIGVIGNAMSLYNEMTAKRPDDAMAPASQDIRLEKDQSSFINYMMSNISSGRNAGYRTAVDRGADPILTSLVLHNASNDAKLKTLSQADEQRQKIATTEAGINTQQRQSSQQLKAQIDMFNMTKQAKANELSGQNITNSISGIVNSIVGFGGAYMGNNLYADMARTNALKTQYPNK